MPRELGGELFKDEMSIPPPAEISHQMNADIDLWFGQRGSHKSQMSSAGVVEVGGLGRKARM